MQLEKLDYSSNRGGKHMKRTIIDASQLELTEKVKEKNGKLHIHCKAGADRTGMYAFIYKGIQNIGTLVENEKEWITKGHNIERYPDLRNWAKAFVKKKV